MSVRSAALRIAVRTMLQTEAMDFERDPRGIVPQGLHSRLVRTSREQLKFVIGHEYSHHLLDHLDAKGVIELAVRELAHESERQRAPAALSIYNTLEVDEFDSDFSALARPVLSDDERAQFAYHAMLWFAYLDVFERIADEITPLAPWRQRTHPPSIDRLHRIARDVAAPNGLRGDATDRILSLTERWSAALLYDVRTYPERFAIYGSVYLAPPNTTWRGRELVDRVDWYF